MLDIESAAIDAGDRLRRASAPTDWRADRRALHAAAVAAGAFVAQDADFERLPFATTSELMDDPICFRKLLTCSV